MMRYMDSLKFNGASEDQLRRVHARALQGRSGLLSLARARPGKLNGASAGAGGASDIVARIMAERLAATWKQNVLIENRPGAGGNIGAHPKQPDEHRSGTQPSGGDPQGSARHAAR